jgi:hypothetical protein
MKKLYFLRLLKITSIEDLGIQPSLNILHVIVHKGKQQWQNFTQQNITGTTLD